MNGFPLCPLWFQFSVNRIPGRGVPDVRLRIWVPKGAEILTFKQVSPELLDLRGARAHPGDLNWEYSTGAWGTESRDYHLRVRVQPASVGDEVLAARVVALANGEEAARSLIRATWTDDRARSTRVNREVAHYTGQQELADAVQSGLDALNRGDEKTALVDLGQAVRIAAATGNTSTSQLLAAVVDVEDASTGQVQLKRDVKPSDVMTLDTRSTRTARVQR